MLGDGCVRSEPPGYLLDAEPGSVDCGRFEALLAEAALATSAPTGAVLLDEALDLWRGRAYEEFADRPFAQAEAVRLDELRLAAIEDRAELALQLGEPARAVANLEAMLVEHPLRERARSLLMTALYGQGRHAAALECFRAYRTQLAEDLGLEPSPSLQAIEVRILNHDLAEVAFPSRVRASPSWAVRAGAFVGRDDESARLIEVVRAHRLVTITGVGGIGKTRLIAETLPELSRRLGLPATVVELVAVEPGQVAAAVATALGLATTGEAASDDIVEYLSISSGLLVLGQLRACAQRGRPAGSGDARPGPGDASAHHEPALDRAPRRAAPAAPTPRCSRPRQPARARRADRSDAPVRRPCPASPTRLRDGP